MGVVFVTFAMCAAAAAVALPPSPRKPLYVAQCRLAELKDWADRLRAATSSNYLACERDVGVLDPVIVMVPGIQRRNDELLRRIRTAGRAFMFRLSKPKLGPPNVAGTMRSVYYTLVPVGDTIQTTRELVAAAAGAYKPVADMEMLWMYIHPGAAEAVVRDISAVADKLAVTVFASRSICIQGCESRNDSVTIELCTEEEVRRTSLQS